MSWLRVFEPEETIGNLWHNVVEHVGKQGDDQQAQVHLDDIRSTLAILFRALGGAHGVEVVEAVPTDNAHKRPLLRRLTHGNERSVRANFDGESLRLPPTMANFDKREFNHAAYLWLTVTAAMQDSSTHALISGAATPGEQDAHYVRRNVALSRCVLKTCPGLQRMFESLCAAWLQQRVTEFKCTTEIERVIRTHLSGREIDLKSIAPESTSIRVPPIPFWLDFNAQHVGDDIARTHESGASKSGSSISTTPKRGERRDLDETNRKDSFIVHRFETILNWAESMDINRKVESDDDENAQKAADDMDDVTLSKHDQSIASKLRLHLELSPAEARHERLAGKFVYPEWNYKKHHYMADHCRVLEVTAQASDTFEVRVNQHNVTRVRRQFEVLRNRRIVQPRQLDGDEIDLDALIESRIQIKATGNGSDRCYLSSRETQRDISVGLLLDTSRSTESTMDGTCIIDVARDALTALAHGLDACGDRFGIWSFSSLKRNRIFMKCCKHFDTPMSRLVDQRIASLTPGHYTRLGTAIRHVIAQLVNETGSQKLLLVLTDGKPNDLDHYEGKHGIEDSRMAVREARKSAVVVHGVIIDEDGQDWFSRIFEPHGFTLLPKPQRLSRALPEIYRSLTQEF